MKKSSKRLLSMLLAMIMVLGLAVPAMAARPMGGDVAETPAGEAAPQVGHSSGKTSQSLAALTAAGDTKTLNASDMTEFTNSGDTQKTDGETEKVADFFTVHYGAKDKLGSGSYTFKAVASQGTTTTESATTAAVTYTLPLAKPEVTAKGDDGKVTLTWATVAEATSYEIYQGETKLDVTPTEASGTYTAVVTGLTNGTEYSFTVKAIRTTPQAEATSEAVTVTPSAEAVSAPQKYVFLADDVEGYTKSSYTEARSHKAGTANHFTLYDNPSKSEVVAADVKDGGPFDDGFEPKQRFSTGGKFTAVDSMTIGFDTAMAATVKVWWGNNGANREIAIYQGASTTPIASDGADVAAKDNAIISTFKVDAAGTYAIGGVASNGGGIYIYKIEVQETKAAETMTFLADDVEGYTKSSYTEARSHTAGTANFFTIYDNPSKSEVVAADVKDGGPFDDGFEPKQRFSTGGKFTAVDSMTIGFTTTEAARVKVWWGNNGAGRSVAVYQGASTTPIASDGADVAAKDNAIISSFKLEAADTYAIGGVASNSGGIYIYKIEVTYGGGKDEVVAKWDASVIGTPVVGTPTVNGGTISVPVSGVGIGAVETDDAITTYADKVVVTMYSSAGTEMGSEEITVIGDAKKSNSVEFAPSVTGKYTFKAVAVRSGEKDIEGAMSAATDFVLPLGVPAVSSASSNGAAAGATTAGVTVMWPSVTEASSYNLYVKEHSATEWGSPISVPAPDSSNVSYVVPDLTIGTEYDFAVAAVRADTTIDGVTVTGSTSDMSTAISATVTANKQIAWVEKVFGTSTTDKSNCVVGSETSIDPYTGNGQEKVTIANGTYTVDFPEDAEKVGATDSTFENLTGDLNTDPEGRVLLSSRDGAGKIKENEGGDGLLFYYTAIPAGTNYTLKADVEVLRWATRDTQNGVGLAAMDRVAEKSWTGNASSNSGNFWNNVYYGGAARLSFSFDKTNRNVYSNVDLGYDNYTKYSYYMGLLAATKIGIPMTANGPYNESSGPKTYYERRFPLDIRIPQDGVTAKSGGNTNRFNLIGNYAVKPAGFSLHDDDSSFMTKYEMTKFTLQLQKNNTGYIVTAWDENGNQLGQNIEYFVKGAMDLSGDKPYHDGELSGRGKDPTLVCLDPDYEYVGLFTSRDMDALFTNVTLETKPASEDDPPVEPPYTEIVPNMSISSGTSANSPDFNLSVAANVEGFVTVTQNGETLPTTYEMRTDEVTGSVERLDIPVTLVEGNNNFSVVFQPDPNQELPAFTRLANTLPLSATSTVSYRTKFSELKNIYVSPTGRDTGYGTKTRPVDVYTAVSAARPGQNIILMDGVYNLTKSISIGRGMSGTQDAPIYFVAEPGAHVVLNGQGKTSVLSQGASWWIFKDFEVVRSSGTGFLVAGNHNIVQNVKLHDNASTGLQISRLNSGDRIPVRPTEDKIDGDLEITDWGDWPCDNLILNCDSYRNYDTGYNGADGFGAKETCGAGNVFDGCAAYWNADDGWDLYAKTEPDKGPLGRVTLVNCVAFENGYEVRKLADVSKQTPEYEEDGYNAVMDLKTDGSVNLKPAGNGNGFKLGGSHLPGAHSLTNSVAFYNRAKGIDSNNGPDIKVHGCTSYNNAMENVGLGSQFSTLNYEVDTTVSFKDANCPTTDADAKSGPTMADATPTGGTSKYDAATYYAWNGTKSVNGSNAEITADNFVSLAWDGGAAWQHGAVRDADGSLNLGDFLKLKDVEGSGAGELVNDATPVTNPDAVVNPPEEGPTGSGGAVSGGNTGTLADYGTDKPATSDKQETFSSKKTGDVQGNTEIVVTNQDGETVADVKIPAEIPAPATKFNDVADDFWAAEAIEHMAGMNIVNGVADGEFGPDSELTRAQLATMLFRLANGKAGTANSFADVASGQWFTDAVGWAVRVGIVTGYSADSFGPNDVITREQLTTMLARFAKLVGLNTEGASDLAGFQDRGSVSAWAADGMGWCVENGIINGVSADTLSPATSATRAQTAVMLDRFIGLLK